MGKKDDLNYRPMTITVNWEGRSIELKLLSALDDLLLRAVLEGLTSAGKRRVVAYLAATLETETKP